MRGPAELRPAFAAFAEDYRASGRLGEGGSRIRRLRVLLHESHAARGWYEAEL